MWDIAKPYRFDQPEVHIEWQAAGIERNKTLVSAFGQVSALVGKMADRREERCFKAKCFWTMPILVETRTATAVDDTCAGVGSRGALGGGGREEALRVVGCADRLYICDQAVGLRPR